MDLNAEKSRIKNRIKNQKIKKGLLKKRGCYMLWL